MTRRLLLLGGGHAHLHVLQALARQPMPGAQVQLLTPQARLVYSGMVPGLVAGHYAAPACSIDLAALAASADVHWLPGLASGLDTSARRVLLADGSVLGYDVLSIDTGAVQDRDRLPGAREHGFFVRPMERFVSLQAALVQRAHDLARPVAHPGPHCAAAANPAEQPRTLDVVVVGGGAGGFELALALQHRLCSGGVERARIALVTGGPAALAGYPRAVVQRAARVLAARRITVLRDRAVAVDGRAVLLASGARLACDAPVISTGVVAPAWLAGSGLALCERGFVATGPTLQSTSHPEVFAAGDVATRADVQHPRSGVHAVRAGPPLAANLRRYVGGGPLQTYTPPRRTLNLLSCGGRQAILSWGDWTAHGAWPWWLKDRIDRAFIARFSLPPAPLGAPTRGA